MRMLKNGVSSSGGTILIFKRLFAQLNLASVVELACGHGRHAEMIADLCGQLTVMDILPENIEACRQRLSKFKNVSYVVNEGYKFDTIGDSELTAIFCYDAMVHFSYDVVRAYLVDTFRVLKPGGLALYHHSNYAAPLDTSYGLNPHARNHMTYPLLQEFASNIGLTIVESHELSWGQVDKLDRVTLLRK